MQLRGLTVGQVHARVPHEKLAVGELAQHVAWVEKVGLLGVRQAAEHVLLPFPQWVRPQQVPELHEHHRGVEERPAVHAHCPAVVEVACAQKGPHLVPESPQQFLVRCGVGVDEGLWWR